MAHRNLKERAAQLTVSGVSEYAVERLSKQTWSDFERLFKTHPAPGAHPCWCMYNHRPGPLPEKKGELRAIQIERTRQEKKALVERGRSHGILVYAQGEPVGWCQYGLSQELPRIDNNPNYCKIGGGNGRPRWRITSFVVRGKYRRCGVALAALRAALAAIHDEGGGLVEAYPIKRWEAYQKYRGSVSMFEKEGFQIVAPLGKSNVLMQKIVRPLSPKLG
jgi:GNAT superfamily N-acetyltransferase